MRSALIILIAAIGTAEAQQPAEYDADAWFAIKFDERASLHEQEARDPDWAPAMERAVAEEVANFDRPMEERVPPGLCDQFPVCRHMPAVELVEADCRTTLCRIEMHWPPDATRAAVGQQVSFLYSLGIDHQGQNDEDETEDRKRVVIIARRMEP